VVDLEFEGPRTIALPSGWRDRSYRPWIEVSVVADATVAAWELTERLWLHWALPVHGGRVAVDEARPFDPGRRSASPGEPERSSRAEEVSLSPSDAAEIVAALLERDAPQIHRHSVLGLVSTLGEDREAFRRRCLRALGPELLASSESRMDAAASLSALAGSIETHRLGGSELRIIGMRCRVGWYPQPLEPQQATDDPMTSGAVRATTR